ncbi:MAG: recombination protein O N-terminal domain-containing protein, partial [Gammaproteobacteria bacterium]
MHEFTDQGYIVHRRRLRETSQLLHILTRHHGMVVLVARGGARATRREAPVEFKA